jgi:ABC-type Zn2+ transport system substrate-binding protein/surface adhesin
LGPAIEVSNDVGSFMLMRTQGIHAVALNRQNSQECLSWLGPEAAVQLCAASSITTSCTNVFPVPCVRTHTHTHSHTRSYRDTRAHTHTHTHTHMHTHAHTHAHTHTHTHTHTRKHTKTQKVMQLLRSTESAVRTFQRSKLWRDAPQQYKGVRAKD